MSRVVFVGNVPYNMGEDELIEVFKSVGQVIGFRLVFDRETGKPRGYGFCEFADHETAESAVRNLNSTDVGGRPLRIDLADSDPFLEGKTTLHGELVDGGETRAQWRERVEKREQPPLRPGGPVRGGVGPGAGAGAGAGMGMGMGSPPAAFLKALPSGVPLAPGQTAMDAISHTLGTIDPVQLTEVLAQMKAFVINHPEHARTLLIAHPQLAHALFQALIIKEIVDPAVLQRMSAAPSASATQSVSAPPPPHMGAAGIPPSAPLMSPPPSMMPAHYPLYPPHPAQQTHLPVPPSVPQPPHYYQQTTPTPPLQHMAAPQPTPSQLPPPPLHLQQPAPQPAVPAPVSVSGAGPGPSTGTPQPQLQAQMQLPQPQAQLQAQAQALPQFPPDMNQQTRDMLLQVLALTPDKIELLPKNEKDAIMMLKSQFAGMMNPNS